MGLTVHFKLAAPKDCDAARAKHLVESMRREALSFYFEGLVDQVKPICSDAKTLRRFACDWLILPVPGEKNTCTVAEILPAEGFLFCVEVGKDCEPLWLGLCRYPLTVIVQGRALSTKKGAGWRLAGFSKTQYASLHGWEYFQRCHCAVINLLAACRTRDLHVKINDEGEYWPRRSFGNLHRNLDEMNGMVAAAGGMLKDLSADFGHGPQVQSPIFNHANFERLEHEGHLKFGRQVEQLQKKVRKGLF